MIPEFLTRKSFIYLHDVFFYKHPMPNRNLSTVCDLKG